MFGKAIGTLEMTNCLLGFVKFEFCYGINSFLDSLKFDSIRMFTNAFDDID